MKKAQDILLLCEEKSRAAEEALKSTELVRAENAIKESQARIEFSTETGRLAALEAERDALEELISVSNERLVNLNTLQTDPIETIESKDESREQTPAEFEEEGE